MTVARSGIAAVLPRASIAFDGMRLNGPREWVNSGPEGSPDAGRLKVTVKQLGEHKDEQLTFTMKQKALTMRHFSSSSFV